MEDYNQQGETAEFSGSLNTIERISRNIIAGNEFERLANAPKHNQHRVNDCLYLGGWHNYNLWQSCHLQNYREAMVYFSEKELEESKQWFPKVEKLIMVGGNQTKKNMIDRIIFFRQFVNWLMLKLKKHGLLMKSASDPNYAMMQD